MTVEELELLCSRNKEDLFESARVLHCLIQRAKQDNVILEHADRKMMGGSRQKGGRKKRRPQYEGDRGVTVGQRKAVLQYG